MTPTGPLRRLSGTEAACAWRHALTGGQTQTTTRLTVAAELSPAHVEQAVARWVREFRALSLRIVEEGGSLWFHEVPGLAVDQLRQETYTSTASSRSQGRSESHGSSSGPGPDHDYDRVRGHGHSHRHGHSGRTGDVLRAGGPLWRLEVGHDPAAAATHLLLTCHPALADGPSTARLLRALLDALLGPGPSGRESAGHRQAPAPDADELTYRPPPPPHPRPGATPIPVQPQPPAPDTAFASAAMTVHGGAEGAAPVSLTARQTARLTAWCRRHLITTDEFFAAALADSCARAAGQEEVALLTAVSLRQRYAERARLSEVGCFVRLVPATVRAGDSGALADRARGYGQALRAADADWRPVRQDHARIRRAVEFETEAGAGFAFRVTQDGCVDTALGHHAALVTRYTTTPYANTSYTGVTSRGVTSCASTTYGATDNTAHQAAYGLSWTAVRSAAPRQLGFLHLSRFRGALTVSLGMPDSTGIEGGSPERAAVGSGALTAPRIAAELAARALAPAT